MFSHASYQMSVSGTTSSALNTAPNEMTAAPEPEK
jgi:hypothetical protein